MYKFWIKSLQNLKIIQFTNYLVITPLHDLQYVPPFKLEFTYLFKILSDILHSYVGELVAYHQNVIAHLHRSVTVIFIHELIIFDF